MDINFKKTKKQTLDYIYFRLKKFELLSDYNKYNLEKEIINIQYEDINSNLDDSFMATILFDLRREGFLKIISAHHHVMVDTRNEFKTTELSENFLINPIKDVSLFSVNPTNKFNELYEKYI